MKIYLTRHGESQWNLEGRLQGSFDSILTAKGIEDSWKLSKYLEQEKIGIDRIYTSVSSRAVETAEIIAKSRKLEPIPLKELKEMNSGSWQGRTWSEIKRLNPKGYKNYWQSPHLYQAENAGEDFKKVEDRVLAFINRIIKENENKNLLIVSHGVVLTSLLNYYQNQPIRKFWDQPPIQGASLSLIEIRAEQARVVFRGLDDYLKN